MEALSRTWLILASLPRSWLAFARSWYPCQDFGNASKELAMDFGKDSMALNTGV